MLILLLLYKALLELYLLMNHFLKFNITPFYVFSSFYISTAIV